MYDVDSITHYTNYMNSNAPCFTGGRIERCPLRKPNVPGDRSAGVSYIRDLERPSLGDVRLVRMHYPYAGNIHDASNLGGGKTEDGNTLDEEFAHLGFDPYVEHGKMVGEDPDFLRKLDQRRKELVAEEAEARIAKAAKASAIISDE
jgi:hypothetical protein